MLISATAIEKPTCEVAALDLRRPRAIISPEFRPPLPLHFTGSWNWEVARGTGGGRKIGDVIGFIPSVSDAAKTAARGTGVKGPLLRPPCNRTRVGALDESNLKFSLCSATVKGDNFGVILAITKEINHVSLY